MAIPIDDFADTDNLNPRKMTSQELHIAQRLADLSETGRWIFMRGMSMIKDCGDHHALSEASGTDYFDPGWLPHLGDPSTVLLLPGVLRRVFDCERVCLTWSTLTQQWIVVWAVSPDRYPMKQIGHGRTQAEAVIMALESAPEKEVS
jgi:hypothetical protein